MGELNVEGMDKIEAELLLRKQSLDALLKNPFDLDNKAQMDELRKRISHFEYSTNLMRLYQATSDGLKLCAGSFFLTYYLPIPQFALTYAIYFGVNGYVLQQLSRTDYYQERAEMRAIYNWALKNGKPDYKDDTDNTHKLANAEIQRLIRILAPVCSTDFMIAWPRVSEKSPEELTGWAKVVNLAAHAATASAGLFSNTTKPPAIDITQIDELKTAVETKALNVSSFQGGKMALSYFLTDPNFMNMFTTKVNDIKSEIPAMIVSTLPTHSARA